MTAYKGYKSYLEGVLPKIQSDLPKHVEGQSPKTLFITCSDSRIMPNQLTDTNHGELFVIRNAGNSIPAANDETNVADGDAATLEYAVKALQVEEIVVCGHTKCGAMGALQSGVDDSLKFIQKYLGRFSDLKLKAKDDWTTQSYIEENVRFQIENIKSYDFVQEAITAGKLEVHGWIYQLEDGEVQVIS